MTRRTTAWIIVIALIAAQVCISVAIVVIDATGLALLCLLDRCWGDLLEQRTPGADGERVNA